MAGRRAQVGRIAFAALAGLSVLFLAVGSRPAARAAASPHQAKAGAKAATEPDVYVRPWLTPPMNTFETTDIWVESPISGAYQYGTETVPAPFGDVVPAGNGSDPAVFMGPGPENKVWVRVRNIGTAPVPAGVKVHVERSDPEGVGITGAYPTSGPGGPGWLEIGVAPLPNPIPPNGYEDVFVYYLPAYMPTAADVTAPGGHFAFHTCLRVWVEDAPGETVVDNQAAFENIAYFHADIVVGDDAEQNTYKDTFVLRNPARKVETFVFRFRSTLPPGWRFSFANGLQEITLKPGEVRRLPVLITPRPASRSTPSGTAYAVDVSATSPTGKLPPVGTRIQVYVVRHAQVTCSAKRMGGSRISVNGVLEVPGGAKGLLVAVGGTLANPFRISKTPWRLAKAGGNGKFAAVLAVPKGMPAPTSVFCVFAGTNKLSPSNGRAKIS